MKVVRHKTAREFLRRAEAWLMQAEAENCLILGIAHDMAARGEHAKTGPYLMTIEAEDGVVGAALMTPPHDLLVSGLPAGAAEVLAQYLAEIGAPLPGLAGPAPETSVLAECWAAKAGRSCRPSMTLRLYRCDRLLPPDYSPGHLRAAVDADVPLLTGWRQTYRREAGLGEKEEEEDHREVICRRIEQRQLFVWEHGRPVCMACWGGETPHAVRVFLVFTPPDLRKQGYATSCVAALTGRLLDSGKTCCCLYADLANPTSNNVYRNLGYQPIGDSRVWRFE